MPLFQRGSVLDLAGDRAASEREPGRRQNGDRHERGTPPGQPTRLTARRLHLSLQTLLVEHLNALQLRAAVRPTVAQGCGSFQPDVAVGPI